MGDKNKSKMTRSVTENLSRDFLTRFMGNGWREGEFGAKKDEGYVDVEEKIELNLGLSLGGRFGIEKGPSTLIRSSSIAEGFPIVRDKNDALTVSPPPVAYSRLMRTTSLPLETEEWRKRKELQTQRRMEAKRRRSEKQRNVKDEGCSGVAQTQDEKKEVIDLNLRGRIEKDRLLAAAKQIDSRVTLPFGTYAWDVFGRESVASKGGNGTGAAIARGKGMHEFISQGSVESQGGSSSELDNKSLPGSGGCDISPASNQDVGSSGIKTKGILDRTSSVVENPSKQLSDMTRSQVREARTSALEDMPCVFTKGDGPNGRRVDGILYQYGKGEEVRIMCVCHGNFHSPAEFVKHAGVTDFTHPLRHIVVNPNSASLM